MKEQAERGDFVIEGDPEAYDEFTAGIEYELEKLEQDIGRREFTEAEQARVTVHLLAAVKACQAAAEDRAKELVAEVAAVRDAGARSLREIAQGLNQRHIEAPRGGAWHPSGVRRLLARLEA